VLADATGLAGARRGDGSAVAAGAAASGVWVSAGVGAAATTWAACGAAVAGFGSRDDFGAGARDGFGLGTTLGVGEGSSDGLSVGVAAGVTAVDGDGCGVCGGSNVAIATGAGIRVGDIGRPGVLITTATGTGFAVLRCMRTATSAPIPRPAITTPSPIAIVGSHPPPPSESDGSGLRRRRGGVDIAARVQRGRQEASLDGANRRRMIRVSVPVDLNAVVSNASAAFALATPLRLADLVATAVVVSLGRRAPQDKRERAVRRTLDGLHAGEFVVEIDGRVYSDAHEVVVCAGVVALRFFARRSYRHAA